MVSTSSRLDHPFAGLNSNVPVGSGSNICTQNGTLVNGNWDTTCGPIPGGLILTHTQLCVGTSGAVDLLHRRRAGPGQAGSLEK